MDGRIRALLSRRTAIPRALSGLGIVLVLVVLAEWVVFARLQLRLIFGPQNFVSLLTSLPFILGLVYGGYRLDRGPFPPERYLRIGGWCFGALATFTLMNVLTMITIPPESLWVYVGWLRWAAAIGGGVGLLIGITEARAIERERVAERATVRAEYAETQREWFDYINSLLRHEVLNTANVITGTATLLMDRHDFDDATRDRLERIARQSENMTRVIQDVNVLLEATENGVAFETMDPAEVLREEVAALEDRYEDVRTDLSVPDGATVVADDLLPRMFANLLSNAVEHNDSETPKVYVAAETTADTVVFHISDNGPGIPGEKIDTLFEREKSRSGTHGLGLYLVRTLAERYGGSVELTDTGEDGTTFTVELPRAGGKPDGPPEGDLLDTAVGGMD